MFLYKSKVINYNMGDYILVYIEYILVHSIQRSFHQGNDEKHGDTVGGQCTCIALFAIACASFKRL